MKKKKFGSDFPVGISQKFKHYFFSIANILQVYYISQNQVIQNLMVFNFKRLTFRECLILCFTFFYDFLFFFHKFKTQLLEKLFYYLTFNQICTYLCLSRFFKHKNQKMLRFPKRWSMILISQKDTAFCSLYHMHIFLDQ